MELSGGQNSINQQLHEESLIQESDYEKYKDIHWSDYVVETNKTSIVDLEDQVMSA